MIEKTEKECLSTPIYTIRFGLSLLDKHPLRTLSDHVLRRDMVLWIYALDDLALHNMVFQYQKEDTYRYGYSIA